MTGDASLSQKLTHNNPVFSAGETYADANNTIDYYDDDDNNSLLDTGGNFSLGDDLFDENLFATGVDVVNNQPRNNIILSDTVNPPHNDSSNSTTSSVFDGILSDLLSLSPNCCLTPVDKGGFNPIVTCIIPEVSTQCAIQKPTATRRNKRVLQSNLLNLEEETHNNNNSLITSCMISHVKNGCRETDEMIVQYFGVSVKRSPIYVSGENNLCFYESLIASLFAMQYFRFLSDALHKHPNFNSTIQIITPILLRDMVVNYAIQCIDDYDHEIGLSSLETFRSCECNTNLNNNKYFRLKFTENVDFPMHFELNFAVILHNNYCSDDSQKSIRDFYAKFKSLSDSLHNPNGSDLIVFDREHKLRLIFEALLKRCDQQSISEGRISFVNFYEKQFNVGQLRKHSGLYLGFVDYKEALHTEYKTQFSNLKNITKPTFNNEMCILFAARILGIRIFTHYYINDGVSSVVAHNDNINRSYAIHSVHLYLVGNHWGTDVSEKEFEQTHNNFDRFGSNSQYTQSLATAQAILFGSNFAVQDILSIRTQQDIVLEDHYNNRRSESPHVVTKRARKSPPSQL